MTHVISQSAIGKAAGMVKFEAPSRGGQRDAAAAPDPAVTTRRDETGLTLAGRSVRKNDQVSRIRSAAAWFSAALRTAALRTAALRSTALRSTALRSTALRREQSGSGGDYGGA